MVLREVMAGAVRHAVYAYCLDSEFCPVEQFMLDHSQSFPVAISMLNSTMREWTPQHGPPFESPHLAKRLRDGACEFKGREKKRRDRAPRVFFFEDGAVIICTNVVMKLFPGVTPDEAIAECLRIREQYFAAKATGENPRVLKGWGVSI